MEFHKKLRAARKQSRLSQEALAERVSASSASISRIEKGTQQPSFELAIALIRALGVPVNQFFLDADNAYMDHEDMLQHNLGELDRIYQELSFEDRQILDDLIDVIVTSGQVTDV